MNILCFVELANCQRQRETGFCSRDNGAQKKTPTVTHGMVTRKNGREATIETKEKDIGMATKKIEMVTRGKSRKTGTEKKEKDKDDKIGMTTMKKGRKSRTQTKDRDIVDKSGGPQEYDFAYPPEGNILIVLLIVLQKTILEVKVMKVRLQFKHSKTPQQEKCTGLVAHR